MPMTLHRAPGPRWLTFFGPCRSLWCSRPLPCCRLVCPQVWGAGLFVCLFSRSKTGTCVCVRVHVCVCVVCLVAWVLHVVAVRGTRSPDTGADLQHSLSLECLFVGVVRRICVCVCVCVSVWLSVLLLNRLTGSRGFALPRLRNKFYQFQSPMRRVEKRPPERGTQLTTAPQ